MNNTTKALRCYFLGDIFENDYEYYEIEITSEDDLNYYVKIDYLDYVVYDKPVNKDEIDRIVKLIG